ncbi:hypothetical protein CEUSTIGMA_g5206.t1 [Chlamydomonas eustigma]|uniref:Uncharacterized protein n=1 Tax=Chlamydomonas eustigma TaxID=1157962 RepID=A0A250X3V9_9CHLO|nr:hypothetical protein CEUSTIGMA_g5206.t1 [Chlamydomonas eustigma]|eukprot:GAX77763.1 hypothetical protein CEUSTIGMA_g5206.t1 [Chlamydomonas eustigma]
MSTFVKRSLGSLRNFGSIITSELSANPSASTSSEHVFKQFRLLHTSSVPPPHNPRPFRLPPLRSGEMVDASVASARNVIEIGYALEGLRFFLPSTISATLQRISELRSQPQANSLHPMLVMRGRRTHWGTRRHAKWQNGLPPESRESGKDPEASAQRLWTTTLTHAHMHLHAFNPLQLCRVLYLLTKTTGLSNPVPDLVPRIVDILGYKNGKVLIHGGIASVLLLVQSLPTDRSYSFNGLEEAQLVKTWKAAATAAVTLKLQASADERATLITCFEPASALVGADAVFKNDVDKLSQE